MIRRFNGLILPGFMSTLENPISFLKESTQFYTLMALCSLDYKHSREAYLIFKGIDPILHLYRWTSINRVMQFATICKMWAIKCIKSSIDQAKSLQ